LVFILIKIMMKTILITMLLFISLISCKKQEETAPIDKQINIENLPNIIAGIWQVSSLTEVKPDKTEDKASMFADVQLMISADKSIMAHNGGDVTIGTWQKGEAVYYGQPTGLSAYSFTINLGQKSPFDRISNQWIITELGEKTIKFDHANPAEKKHLVLTKM
jgi:hypothetical protein